MFEVLEQSNFSLFQVVIFACRYSLTDFKKLFVLSVLHPKNCYSRTSDEEMIIIPNIHRNAESSSRREENSNGEIVAGRAAHFDRLQRPVHFGV